VQQALAPIKQSEIPANITTTHEIILTATSKFIPLIKFTKSYRIFSRLKQNFSIVYV